jgi:peptide/nickel transport system ATP-binding protein
MNADAFVQCSNLMKIYKIAELEVIALQGLDLVVQRGEMMALVGPSGAGKSTLLNVVGGLDVPSAGSVEVGGWNLLTMASRDRVQYKRAVVGFVWQQPARNLLPYLTVRENVELPMTLSRMPGTKRRQRAMELLDVVGLADRAGFRPDQISGGQQQRVAIAVALANNPPLLLGDELTGQVDTASAAEVFAALRRVNEAYGTTTILVTHDPLVANTVDRLVAIRDGRTSTEVRRRIDSQNGAVLDEEEWVILDPAGRLQLPQAFVEHLSLRDRVKVRMEEDHVSVWPGFRARHAGPVGEVEEVAEPAGALSGAARDGAAVAIDHLTRTFYLGAEEVHAVQDVSLQIEPGTLTVFKGRSGSGKTTLLNLVAGLDEPTAGTVAIDGQALARMSSRQRIALRRRQIGFVYQTFGLLPFLSAEENVAVPLRLLRRAPRARSKRVAEALALVGLTARAHHRVYELSGGEQQRVAIARALVKQPVLLLADEPTGQLDSMTGAAIIALLRQVADETGVTVIVATHDPKILDYADAVHELRDGRLVDAEGLGTGG